MLHLESPGTKPLSITVELIYQLATHYPDIVHPLLDFEDFLDVLAKYGILKVDDVSWFIGRHRTNYFDFRQGKGRSLLIRRLMTHLALCLEHKPLEEVKAIIADAHRYPVRGSRLQAFDPERKKRSLQEVFGMDASRFYDLSFKEKLPKSVAIFVRLLEAFPDLAPLSPHGTALAYADVLRAHGITSYAELSRTVGRVRQAGARYVSGDLRPSPTVMSLMHLVMRFQENYPFATYLQLVETVFGWHGEAAWET